MREERARSRPLPLSQCSRCCGSHWTFSAEKHLNKFLWVCVGVPGVPGVPGVNEARFRDCSFYLNFYFLKEFRIKLRTPSIRAGSP